jgi:NDP-sugar pyrophosphorylase family protein
MIPTGEPRNEGRTVPFERLIAKDQLISYQYGFWAAMDTFKEKQQLEDLYARGEAPWAIWRSDANGNGKGGAATMTQIQARSLS